MTRGTVSLLLLLVGATVAPSVRAADGANDLTFWGDGRYAGSASPDNLGLTRLLEAPDGRLVWVGLRQSTQYYRGTWRRLGDGSESGCDLVLPSVSFAVPVAATFDSSGRLVVAGTAVPDSGGNRLLFARYFYPSCALDTDFDGDGVLLLDIPNTESVSVLAIADDGDAIAFAGLVEFVGATDSDGLVGRLQPNGALDATFSGDGLLTFDGRAGNELFRTLEVEPGGRLYVAGDGALPDGTQRDFYLLGLQSNGSPIPGFGLDGFVTVDFTSSAALPDDVVRDFALLPDGRLALVGYAYGNTGSAGTIAVLGPDGELDPAFDGDGLLVDPQRLRYEAVAVQGNGRLVLAAPDAPPAASFFVARRLLSGALDPTFAGGSWVPVAFPEGGNHNPTDLALQAGRVVVGGTLFQNSPATNLAAVARLQNDYVFADGFEIGSAWFWSSTTP